MIGVIISFFGCLGGGGKCTLSCKENLLGNGGVGDFALWYEPLLDGYNA